MAAVVGASGLAGCGLIGGDGGPSTPAGEWQYDPSALGTSPNVAFGSMDYGQLYEMRDELPPSMQDSFEANQEMEDSPVSLEDFDQLVGVGGGSARLNTGSSADWEELSLFGSMAITGSFDRDAMVQQMEEESEGEVEETGDYEGYTIYEVPDIGETGVGGVSQQYQGSATMGVGDSAVVVGLSMTQSANLDATGTDAVESMIDASSGNAPRLSGTSGPAADLQGRINDNTLAVGIEVDPELVQFVREEAGQGGAGGMGTMAGMIEGMRGVGLGGDVQPDTTTFTYVLLYDSASSAEDSGIVQLMGDSTDQIEQQPAIDSFSLEQDGSAIVAEITGDTETIFEQGAAPGGAFDVAPPSA